MNTKLLIEQHQTAIEKLGEIRLNEIMRDNLIQSINGVGGRNFPDLKKDWQGALKRCEAEIDELTVDYKCYINSLN